MVSKTNWSNTNVSGSQPPWKLKFVLNKEYCASSLIFIQSGEMICSERPTTFAIGHHPFTSNQIAEIDAKVKDLIERPYCVLRYGQFFPINIWIWEYMTIIWICVYKAYYPNLLVYLWRIRQSRFIWFYCHRGSIAR
jgi:hypothetical protein